MEEFTCPQCGCQSTFDPWIESANCPRCGFLPPAGTPSAEYVRWTRRYAYQQFLEELQDHWCRRRAPEPEFELEARWDAAQFFRAYCEALGEVPRDRPGPGVSYVRDYEPNETEAVIFAGAYAHLRRGDREMAASELKALTLTTPEFVDPWVWLSATTDDPVEQVKYLEKATRCDAGHPLARDALLLSHGGDALVLPTAREQVVTAQCPRCGGAWEYRPGEGAIVCPYCSAELPLKRADIVDGAAGPLHALRLKRRVQGHTWHEVARVIRCQTCGAEMSMTRHLARVCAFCGSSNVLATGSRQQLEQPDGFLPFTVDEKMARLAIAAARGGGVRRLRSWWGGRSEALRSLAGIYLPFWVFDVTVQVSQVTRSWVRAEKETLGQRVYENLLLPAFDVPPVDLLEQIYPFHVGSLVPYEAGLLANWPAALYTRDVELKAEEAYDAVVALARGEIGRIPRAGRQVGSATMQNADDVLRAYEVTGATYQLLVLPVWVARVGDDEAACLALVNGQTGRTALGSRRPVPRGS